jgi:dTDP-4-amino-4,6-dideoxygalactose transaminase
VGLVQLAKLPTIVQRRRQNAGLLLELLGGDARFELPETTDEHVFTRFVVCLDGDLGPPGPLGRPRGYVDFARHMNGARVEVEWQYRPLHLAPEFGAGPFPARPVAEARWERAIALPVQPGLGEPEIRLVAAAARSHPGRAGRARVAVT